MESTSATTTPAEKALAMLDAFAGVGVNTFDLTITNIKEDERGRQTVAATTKTRASQNSAAGCRT